jgi:hypothetical protein
VKKDYRGFIENASSWRLGTVGQTNAFHLGRGSLLINPAVDHVRPLIAAGFSIGRQNMFNVFEFAGRSNRERFSSELGYVVNWFHELYVQKHIILHISLKHFIASHQLLANQGN